MQLDLVQVFRPAESDEVEENQIISQEFEKGEMVPKYTTVKLVVCSGNASVEVVDVMKKSVEDAQKTYWKMQDSK